MSNCLGGFSFDIWFLICNALISQYSSWDEVRKSVNECYQQAPNYISHMRSAKRSQRP